MWWKMKRLFALSQKNKKNRVLCPILRFQYLLENFNFQQVSLLDLCHWTHIKINVVKWHPIIDTWLH